MEQLRISSVGSVSLVCKVIVLYFLLMQLPGQLAYVLLLLFLCLFELSCEKVNVLQATAKLLLGLKQLLLHLC